MADDSEQLLDSLRVRQLVEQYGRAVDSLDVAMFEACFTDEVVADYSEISNAAAMRLPRGDFAAGILRGMSGFDATQHLISNVTVDFAPVGEMAECQAYVQATHLLDGRLWTVGGVYTNQVVQTSAGWRIASLRLANRWQSGDAAIRDLAIERGTRGQGLRRIS